MGFYRGNYRVILGKALIYGSKTETQLDLESFSSNTVLSQVVYS